MWSSTIALLIAILLKLTRILLSALLFNVDVVSSYMCKT